jgi:opacity protein-like surface antigen
MSRFLISALVSVAALVGAAAASAQDTSYEPREKTSGLYVRGDAGYSFTGAANRSFGNADQGESYVFGAGVGYRFFPQFRTDFTLGYRGDYGFDQRGAGLRARADLDSIVGMANAYYDIVTIRGLTPYIGAGVGVADNSYGNTRITNAAGATIATLNGHSRTEFAWQATAGVSYAFTPNWSLDVGYHYVDLGTAQTGSTLTVPGVGLVTGSPIRGDLQSHDVTIGVRYAF